MWRVTHEIHEACFSNDAPYIDVQGATRHSGSKCHIQCVTHRNYARNRSCRMLSSVLLASILASIGEFHFVTHAHAFAIIFYVSIKILQSKSRIAALIFAKSLFIGWGFCRRFWLWLWSCSLASNHYFTVYLFIYLFSVPNVANIDGDKVLRIFGSECAMRVVECCWKRVPAECEESATHALGKSATRALGVSVWGGYWKECDVGIWSECIKLPDERVLHEHCDWVSKIALWKSATRTLGEMRDEWRIIDDRLMFYFY